jgi:DNA-binding transcriptional MerR regulator
MSSNVSSNDYPEAQLHIGELARCAGVTSRAIRHYHATGLLPEPPRDAAGYRRYGPADLTRLVNIGRLRALGMPLDHIAKTLEDSPQSGAELPAALLALAVDVDAEIERLRGVHERLLTLADSDDLVSASDVLTAGLRARGLVDPVHPTGMLGMAGPLLSDPEGIERYKALLQRFQVVSADQVDDLAADFAELIPLPATAVQPVEVPMMDRLFGDRLTPAQRACMGKLRTLLEQHLSSADLHADAH